jgi:hypothetical protein
VSVIYFTDRDPENSFRRFSAEQDSRWNAMQITSHTMLRTKMACDGWRQRLIAITHNSRIRYTPNEKDAVIAHAVRLLVIVGHAPYPVLAKSFVATRERVGKRS